MQHENLNAAVETLNKCDPERDGCEDCPVKQVIELPADDASGASVGFTICGILHVIEAFYKPRG